MRALIRKKCNPESWHGDVWEDMDEAGDIEPLNSDESCLPVEVASPPSLRNQLRIIRGNRNGLSLRQLPWKTMLILFRIHPHHPSLLPDPWLWLLDCGVLRSEVDWKPATFLLGLYK